MGNRVESQELICLGSRIRERWLSAGLSQEALVEKAGVSPNTVSRIEGGLTEMYVGTFQKFVYALSADVGDLLCWEGHLDSGNSHAESILRRMGRMREAEQAVVAQTVYALADTLEQSRQK